MWVTIRALPFNLPKPAAGEAQLRALAGLAHLGRLSAAQYQAKRGVIGGRTSRVSVPVQLAGFFAHANKSPSVVLHYVRRPATSRLIALRELAREWVRPLANMSCRAAALRTIV